MIVEISKDSSQITITPTAVSRPIRGRHRIEDLIAASSPKAFGGEDNWGKVVVDSEAENELSDSVNFKS